MSSTENGIEQAVFTIVSALAGRAGRLVFGLLVLWLSIFFSAAPLSCAFCFMLRAHVLFGARRKTGVFPKTVATGSAVAVFEETALPRRGLER